MCCGKGVWKRVVVFWLTFGLGVFVSGLFLKKVLSPTVCPISERQLSAENPKPAENLIPETKNCVPVDGSLKYENLYVKKNGKYYLLVKNPKTKVEKAERKDDKNKTPENEQEKIKAVAKSQPEIYNPAKDSSEYQCLLHREKCFETQEQR